MRARQAFLAAAIFCACAAQAAASPLIQVPSGAFLQANRGIENVRWRRHHRGFFWSERGDTVGRGDTDGSSSSRATRSLNSAAPATGSEIFRLDRPRRRGWVDPPPPR
jgi:hypothetical protein